MKTALSKIPLAYLISSLMLVLPAHADISETQSELLTLTIQQIGDRMSEAGASRDASGHVEIRCSIIFSAMAEMIPVVLKEQGRETDEKMNAFQKTYSERSNIFAQSAFEILQYPENEILELHTAIFNYWAEAYAVGAAQIFKNTKEGSDAGKLRKAFNDELDICNYLASERE